MDIRDAEEIYLRGSAKFEELIARTEFQFYWPVIQMQMGIMAGAMGPEQLALLDDETKEQLKEVLNAA